MNGTDIVMIAGILTGRPEEEVSGLSSDLLQRFGCIVQRSEGKLCITTFPEMNYVKS